MRKYTKSQKIWAVALTLVMVLGMIPPVSVTAVGADYVTRVADPSTMNAYQELFLESDTIGVDLTTENAGGVWTDKSVFAANSIPAELTDATSEENTKISVTDTGDNYLVALSALASNKEIVGYATNPTDTMLILDLSGSMVGSTSAMVTAANKAIVDLLALNEHNRVGVVLFSGNSQFGNSNTSTATVLMPLGRYTTTSYTGNGADRVPQYIRSENEYVSVAGGVSPRTGLGSSKGTSGGTFTQNGVYKAMDQLVNATDKVIPEGSLQAGTTRLPIMVLMSDGEPTAASKSYTNIGTSNVGTGATGKSYQSDMSFLTQLTMAYAKREIETAYGRDSRMYTLGYSVADLPAAICVLDPEYSATPNRVNTLWNTYLNTAPGGSFNINAENSQGKSVTKHTDPANKYTKTLEDYRYYTDEYFAANRSSDLTDAFQDIVDEIIIQSKYYPTYVEKDFDHDGYVTFTDKIGGYMEITNVHGIVVGDTLYSGALLARGFENGSNFGTVDNPTELGDNLVRSVKERLGIADTAIARQLLQNAYYYGQLSYTSDTDFSNYIGWYSDVNGNYLDFWYEGITSEPPTGATHIVKSYVMLGNTDTAHGIAASDMMYASIRVAQEIGDQDGDGISGETLLTWQIPASLVPTVTYKVNVISNSSGKITGVNSMELENANVKPIRLLYEVALQENIHEWNIAEQINDGYKNSTANKDAGYVFYTNQWKKENGTVDTTRNTYSHFEPSLQNEWYYYTEDAIIYINTDGTEYTGAAAPSVSGTYYRAYQVFEKLETGAYRMHTHYEQISAESLKKAEKSGSNWVIPKGTVFRFWDPFQESKTANATDTHAYAEYPTITYDGASGHYYALDVLGNNGKLTVTPATGIKVSKSVEETVPGVSNTFTFVISGGTGTATLIRLDDHGQEAGRENLTFADGKAEFTLSADETVYIIGLADGTAYTISEKGNQHYAVSSVTVNGTAVSGKTAQITASAQTIQSAAFVNSPKSYGDLFITKEVVSDHAIPEAIQNQSFAVTVNVGAALAGQSFTVNTADATGSIVTTTETVASDGTLALTIVHGQTYQIVDLPEGTVVTVTENLTAEQSVYFTGTVKTRDHTGADQDEDNTVTIGAKTNSTAVLTNTYAPKSTTVDLDINGKKIFEVDQALTEAVEFTFQVQHWNGSAWEDMPSMTASVQYAIGENGEKTFSIEDILAGITYDHVGEDVYQIVEVPGSVPGVTYDAATHTFTVTVTDDNGQLKATVTGHHQDSVVSGGNGWTVLPVFHNSYDTAPVSINVIKTVEDTSANPDTSKAGFRFTAVETDETWTEKVGGMTTTEITDGAGEARFTATYKDPGTYYFVISEVNGGQPGWTYDNTQYRVKVVISEDSDGNLTAAMEIITVVGSEVSAPVVYTNSAAVSFKNTYDPVDAQVALEVSKHLEGRALAEGEFTFAVFQDGQASHTDTTNALAVGTNVADGTVTFNKKLSFSQVGTYHYDVVEITGNLGGVSYDGTVYDMVVEVTDNGDGTLKAVYYFEDAVTQQVTFTNKYKAAQTEIVLSGTKTLTGRPLVNAEFQFTLTQINGETDLTAKADGVQLTASNNPDNNHDGTTQFAFPAITYTDAGIYYYLVEEVNAGTTALGVTYSTEKYVLKVTVTDNGDGQLTAASEVVGANTVAFTNTYVPQGTSANLHSSKELTGRVMIDGEFSFVLTKTDSTYDTAAGTKLQTVKNAENGTITFDTLHFNAAGDYYYVVEEEAGSAGGVTYDETKYHIHISVVDNHVGSLVATTTIVRVTTAGEEEVTSIAFHNNYEVTGGGQLPLSGVKTLTGKTLDADMFTFGLFDSTGNLLESVKNDVNGKFAFNPLSYDKDDIGKTYTYQVREILPEVGGHKVTYLDGITYDTKVYDISVTITDNLEGGIEITANVNGQPIVQDMFAFTNTYSVDGHDHVTITGTKELTGRNMVSGEFTFGLFDENGNPVKNDQGSQIVASAAADGSFTFPDLAYGVADIGKTFTYKVKELIPTGADKGVTYDTAVYTVVVSVVDNGSGKVEATCTVNGSPFTPIVFRNTYQAAPAEHILEATKIYEKGLKGDDFTFVLEGKIDSTEVYQAKKNDASGKIIFDKLTFAKEGTYTFTVTETDKVLGFINYSKEVYTVNITVTDNKEGQLEVTNVAIVDSSDASANTITFENVYILDDDAKLTIHGNKTLSGFRTQLKENEFTFGLYDANGVLIEAVGNAADGSFRFKALEYNEKDAGKTYTYTVQEIIPAGAVDNKLDGYTYDVKVYTVKVTISDNDQGGILVNHTVDGVADGPITFSNQYNVTEATVKLEGKKSYDKPLAGNDFEFVLEGKIDGVAIKQEKKNDASGKIFFDELTFAKEGTYEFTVKEKEEALGFIEYSKVVNKVTIKVEDNEKGALVATVTINDKTDGEITFVNNYKMVDADNELTLTGTKTLTGRDMVAEEFSFGLYDADNKLLQTAKNDATGAFAFTKLTYEIGEGETKEYTYTVKEIAGTDPCITYDSTVYTVKVTVKDNGKGEAVLDYTVGGAADTKIAFANTYTAPAPVTAKIYIQKNVVNKTEPGIGLDGFTFQLQNGDQKLTVKSDATGKAGFQMTFGVEHVGESYELKISEVKGKTAGMTYDTTVHTVKVKVSQNTDGTLAVAINDQATDQITLSFTNTYEKPATPVTGDSFPLFLVGTLMVISAAGIVAMLLAKRKKEGKRAN